MVPAQRPALEPAQRGLHDHAAQLCHRRVPGRQRRAAARLRARGGEPIEIGVADHVQRRSPRLVTRSVFGASASIYPWVQTWIAAYKRPTATAGSANNLAHWARAPTRAVLIACARVPRASARSRLLGVRDGAL